MTAASATPTATAWRIDAVGDRCLLVGLGTEVDPATSARVHALAQRLRERPIEGVRDIVPAFTTLALHYRPERFGLTPFATLRELLLERLAEPLEALADSGRLIEVPVCYGSAAQPDFGPDLDEVAARCGLAPAEVIERHLASAHRVYMLGFAPGFPFIGGLDPALAMPRRANPRTRIPPGSVAIAREQTCIYPLETPGGWNLIGRTPLRLFDPGAEPPCRLAPGDAIRFVAIDADTYRGLLAEQAGHAA
ncbi:5-oxoprolinase subunit PxpB [Roseateles sp. DAIF2]|uniref:5-oxoprolinase subunit PxpB n=1 Tax=Roseateles sp. DAIF2 TaxID=2714952 RepID=UPI0018A304ED|nr:5-oxoprolinase subunit PxpB [Roseateles sp. DAIF2]QPF71952.1 5-oxoprolinase subunit PxpB [Roseateles sp. DAIF2]